MRVEIYESLDIVRMGKLLALLNFLEYEIEKDSSLCLCHFKIEDCQIQIAVRSQFHYVPLKYLESDFNLLSLKQIKKDLLKMCKEASGHPLASK